MILTSLAAIDATRKRSNVPERSRARGVEGRAMLLTADTQVVIVKFGLTKGNPMIYLTEDSMVDWLPIVILSNLFKIARSFMSNAAAQAKNHTLLPTMSTLRIILRNPLKLQDLL